MILHVSFISYCCCYQRLIIIGEVKDGLASRSTENCKKTYKKMAVHSVLLVSVRIGSAVVAQYRIHKEMQLQSHGFDFTTTLKFLTSERPWTHQQGLFMLARGDGNVLWREKKIKPMKSSLWWIACFRLASDLCELIGSDALAKQSSVLSVLIIKGPLSQQEVLLYKNE